MCLEIKLRKGSPGERSARGKRATGEAAGKQQASKLPFNDRSGRWRIGMGMKGLFWIWGRWMTGLWQGRVVYSLRWAGDSRLDEVPLYYYR